MQLERRGPPKGSPRVHAEPPVSHDTRVGMRGPKGQGSLTGNTEAAPRTPADARTSKSRASSSPPRTPNLQKQTGQDTGHAPAASTDGTSAQTNPDRSCPLFRQNPSRELGNGKNGGGRRSAGAAPLRQARKSRCAARKGETQAPCTRGQELRLRPRGPSVLQPHGLPTSVGWSFHGTSSL